MDETKNVTIRGVHENDWRAITAEARMRGVTVGQLITVMWHDWQRDHSIVTYKQQSKQ